MKKLVSSIHVGLAFSKRKIFGLTLLFLMPLKVNANDMNSSYQVSVARNIRHEQENRLQDEKNDSAMSPNFIAIFQPFSTNLIVSSDIVLRYPLEVEIYSYPTPNSVILINNRELKMKQEQVKLLSNYSKFVSNNPSFLDNIKIADNLLKAAESYYVENTLKPFNPNSKRKKSKFSEINPPFPSNSLVSIYITSIKLGRVFEDEGTRLLNFELNKLKIESRIIELPISSISVENFPDFYSRSELCNGVSKPSVLASDRIALELETIYWYSFDSNFNFVDFPYLWSLRDIDYSSKKADYLMWKFANPYIIRYKAKKSLLSQIFTIRELSLPTKRQIRDACVDGISKFFRFKKWMHKNVQRPLTNYIRSKTGDLFLASPHLQPFKRKYGFVNFNEHFNPINIKYDYSESIQSRWQHYNKIEFDVPDSVLLEQCLDNISDSPKLISQINFVSLPLTFNEFEFTELNTLPRYNYTGKVLKKRPRFHFWNSKQVLKRGLKASDVLLPQSLSKDIPWGKKTNQPEAFSFSRIINYDRRYLAIRHRKASRSWRYHIFYHRVAEEIMNETKVLSNHSIPPTLLIGPLLLKQKGHDINQTGGYGLGYLKRGYNKFYLNPVTGLISIYQNKNYEDFYGDDKTTYYGVDKGRPYYSDKYGIKYFYVGNFDDTFFGYLSGESHIRQPIQSRKNPFYWRREYYVDVEYLKIKKLSGPWSDVRANVREHFQDFYKVKDPNNRSNP